MPSISLLAAGDPAIAAGGITLAQSTQAAGAFLGSVVAAALVRRLLPRALDRDANRHVGVVLGRFLGLVIVAVGIVYAFGILGIRIGPLLGALGVGGVAIAFAAQDILQNLIAGVLLQIRRPLRVGEQVASGDHEGIVVDVNLRTTVLHTYDGLVVYLPNADVLKQAIVNYTRTPQSRTSLTVGLAYDTDLGAAREVLIQACLDADGVHAKPPPEVWVEEFADSSINLAVRFWHAADIASRWRVRSAVAVSAKRALDRAGMTIPFPQRVLWSAKDD